MLWLHRSMSSFPCRARRTTFYSSQMRVQKFGKTNDFQTCSSFVHAIKNFCHTIMCASLTEENEKKEPTTMHRKSPYSDNLLNHLEIILSTIFDFRFTNLCTKEMNAQTDILPVQMSSACVCECVAVRVHFGSFAYKINWRALSTKAEINDRTRAHTHIQCVRIQRKSKGKDVNDESREKLTTTTNNKIRLEWKKNSRVAGPKKRQEKSWRLI